MKLNHSWPLLAVVCASAIIGQPRTQGEQTPSSTPNIAKEFQTVIDDQGVDGPFLAKAAMDNASEVLIGQLGIAKTDNLEVKALCQMMVFQHSIDVQNVKFAAKQAGLTVVAAPDMPHYFVLQRLKKLDGAEFDKELVLQLLRDHVAGIHDFELAAQYAKSPSAARIARQSIGVLRDHFQACEFVAGNIGISKATVLDAVCGRLKEMKSFGPSVPAKMTASH